MAAAGWPQDGGWAVLAPSAVRADGCWHSVAQALGADRLEVYEDREHLFDMPAQPPLRAALHVQHMSFGTAVRPPRPEAQINACESSCFHMCDCYCYEEGKEDMFFCLGARIVLALYVFCLGARRPPCPPGRMSLRYSCLVLLAAARRRGCG